TPYGMMRDVLLDSAGVPCNPPPWGTLAAIDLAAARVRWEVPLGAAPGVAAGSINLGGAMITGGGLVFIAGTFDQHVWACDQATGRALWSTGRLAHRARPPDRFDPGHRARHGAAHGAERDDPDAVRLPGKAVRRDDHGDRRAMERRPAARGRRGSERLVRRRPARARDVRAVAAINEIRTARVAYKTPHRGFPLPATPRLLAAALACLAPASLLSQGTHPGLDPANRDTTCAPCQDFYRYANGGWLARTTLPPEYASYGSFTELVERYHETLHRIVDRLAP